MAGKVCKLESSKNLSGLDGTKDVSFGSAAVNNRAARDFSKDGSASKPSTQKFDDFESRLTRWGNWGL